MDIQYQAGVDSNSSSTPQRVPLKYNIFSGIKTMHVPHLLTKAFHKQEKYCSLKISFHQTSAGSSHYETLVPVVENEGGGGRDRGAGNCPPQ